MDIYGHLWTMGEIAVILQKQLIVDRLVGVDELKTMGMKTKTATYMPKLTPLSLLLENIFFVAGMNNKKLIVNIFWNHDRKMWVVDIDKGSYWWNAQVRFFKFYARD